MTYKLYSSFYKKYVDIEQFNINIHSGDTKFRCTMYKSGKDQIICNSLFLARLIKELWTHEDNQYPACGILNIKANYK